MKKKAIPFKELCLNRCLLTSVCIFFFSLSASKLKANSSVYETIGIEQQGDSIYKMVEEMPRFPGCEEMESTIKEKFECATNKLLGFIARNIVYPDAALKANVEGMVVVQFIIEKDGQISNLNVVRGLEKGCSEAAINALNKMPSWIPGKHEGEIVRVQYTLPVKFKLADEPVALSPPISALDADEMPRFPGCEDLDKSIDEIDMCTREKLLQFVFSNLKYPKEARSRKIEGMTIVKFTISAEGVVEQLKLIKDIGGGCGEEVLRIMGQSPVWIPAIKNEKQIAVEYTLPVQFKLNHH